MRKAKTKTEKKATEKKAKTKTEKEAKTKTEKEGSDSGPSAASVVPFSLKDAPALIERIFPAQKISIESQAERTAGAGQTLTALGSYWKGRKPLVLVRACVLGALLPATDNPERDLRVFELLMAMDDAAFVHRVKDLSKEDVERWGGADRDDLLDADGRWILRGAEKREILGRILGRIPYSDRLDRRSLRPEELPEWAYDGIWREVNAHLGTQARSHTELVEQLGIMRFGHKPRVADTFAGGGAIPFEAARLGCAVYASDLNPVACMLTWGAFHIIGADEETRASIQRAKEQVVAAVDAEITKLGIEHDSKGNRLKALLYCTETTSRETGWRVPLATSWVISPNRATVARLAQEKTAKAYRIDVLRGVDAGAIEAAKTGTIQEGWVVHEIAGRAFREPVTTLRGDRATGGNELRPWDLGDFLARPDDLLRERIYCLQWTEVTSGAPSRAPVFFTEMRPQDEERERQVEEIVRGSLNDWQARGLVPTARIVPGEKTEELIRTRGWSHWHHLFCPRHLLLLAKIHEEIRKHPDGVVRAALLVHFTDVLDKASKLTRWRTSRPAKKNVAPSSDYVEQVFYIQAFATYMNYGARLFPALRPVLEQRVAGSPTGDGAVVRNHAAKDLKQTNDIYITDPPYADAVNYHELTEYFIAWLHKNPPSPWRDWVWDSRRDLAIQGAGEDFRREMVMAYRVMADQMPENGLQVVMFTHQDSRVWGDMAGIFWGAGLRVTAAWCVATETESALKDGGYVQGTVLLVLRKRKTEAKTYKAELVQEIREEVARQIETLTGLNQRARLGGRDENIFEDVDLQLAGYAAALRVLTGYTHLDGKDMTEEALRPRADGQSSPAEEIIDYAVSVANEHLVPEGLGASIWDGLSGTERFYLRMLDREAAGLKRLDAYQSFAKAFKVKDYRPLLAKSKPHDARLKSAEDLKKAEVPGFEIDKMPLRAMLYALAELQGEGEAEDALHHLRDNVTDYFKRRKDLEAIAKFLAAKLARLREDEASAARVLEGLIRNEKI